MQQQQHIQAIMKTDEEKLQVTPLTIEFCFVFEFVCFIFFFVFNLFFSVFHQSRNWHRFSNFVLPKLLVGCQWVSEPILSPLLYKLIHTWVGSNSGANLKHKIHYFQIILKIILKMLYLQCFSANIF